MIIPGKTYCKDNSILPYILACTTKNLQAKLAQCASNCYDCTVVVFRIVCFANYKDLKRAVEKYDGYELNGRKIKLIQEYKERR